MTRRFVRPCLAFLAGSLMPWAFSPQDGWWLGLLLPAVVLYLAHRGRAFLHAWLFGIGWFGVGAWWLAQTFHLYGGLPYPVGALLVLLIGMVLGLFPAAGLWLALRLATTPAWWLLSVPASLVGVEWLRGHLFTGLPWTAWGNLLLDTPAVGWLAVLGVYGACLLPGLAIASLALLALYRKVALTGLALLALLVLAAPKPDVGGGAILRAALVQGNIPQQYKWDPAFLRRTLDTYLRLSASLAADADVIVWPESAVPFFPSRLPEWDAWLLQRMRSWRRPVLYGGDRLLEDGRSAEVGMYAVDADGRRFVGKHHLVPFGEYVPTWLSFVHTLVPNIADFRPARDPGVLRAAGHAFGILICYESIFPEEARARVSHGAEVLVVASNDAWYGRSPAVWQHTQAARARAVETGRYLLRVGNTGITAVIDPAGQVRASLPWWRADALLAPFRPLRTQTPYLRWGDAPTLGASLLILLFLAWRRWTRREKTTQSRP